MEEFICNFNGFKEWLFNIPNKPLYKGPGSEYEENLGFNECLAMIRKKFKESNLDNAF